MGPKLLEYELKLSTGTVLIKGHNLKVEDSGVSTIHREEFGVVAVIPNGTPVYLFGVADD